MTTLRVPIRDLSPLPVDAATSQRLYRGVVERRERRHERAMRRGMVLWFAVGAMAATVPVMGHEWWRSRGAKEIAAVEGPVTLVGGRSLAVLETRETASVTETDLADGSVLLLDSGTRLESLENTSSAVSLLLTRGRATFDIRPGGPRRWSIECGLATVEVVGTRFTITRAGDHLDVDVERGTVLVRGERVADRVQRLTAGGHIEVSGSVVKEAVQEAPAKSEANAAPPSALPEAPPAAHGWRELATRGHYADAYRLLGPSGMGSAVVRSGSAADLMALADVARLSGHPGDAVAPLERIVSEHPDDPRAPLSAFTLGKIHLSALGRPALAAKDFERALVMGLPSGLVEDTYAYLVEAKSAAGDIAGARATAQAYRTRFPASARAKDVLERTER